MKVYKELSKMYGLSIKTARVTLRMSLTKLTLGFFVGETCIEFGMIQVFGNRAAQMGQFVFGSLVSQSFVSS